MPPSQQSGTVGSYGSFWLPSDADGARTRRSPASHGKSSDGPGQSKGASARTPTDVRQAMQQGGRSTGSSSLPSAGKTSKGNASASQAKQKATTSFANPKSASSGSGKSIPLKVSGERARNAARPAENFASPNQSKSRAQGREAVLPAKADKFFHPEDQGHRKDRRHRGAKRALSAGDKEVDSQKNETQVKKRVEYQAMTVGKTVSSTLGNEAGRLTLPETLRPVLPSLTARLALLLKDGRRVARFAIDLPGGAKLSVRIELFGKKARLAFITADSDLRTVLRSAARSISAGLTESGFDADDFLVAASYRELGKSLPKAA